ncbi:MAG: hypothetical protein SOZ52_08050 [Pyramidobacter sp.]|nr:hypothetical protein [Pyramidobacter sp.]
MTAQPMWHTELEALAARQESRTAEYLDTLEKRAALADQKTLLMQNRTLDHIKRVYAEEAKAFQEETRVLVQRLEDEWAEREREACSQDLSPDVEAALNAILGETEDKR